MLFVALIIWHRQLKEQLQHCHTLSKLNQESLSRIKRDFAALTPCPPHVADYFSLQDKDLNLYGPGSLGQLLFNLSTSLGDARLAEWLSRGNPSPRLELHQQAIQELAPQLDLRQRLYAYARSPHHSGGHQLHRFQSWAEDTADNILIGPRAKSLGRLLTLLSLAGLALVIVRLSPAWILALPVLLNLGFLGLHGRRFRQAFNNVDLQSGALNCLSDIVEIIGEKEYQAQVLQQTRESLKRSPQRPGPALRRLAAIIHHSSLRFNAIPCIFLQSLLLWDFHVALKLQHWRKQHARHVALWLDAVACFEALSALANLAHENPDWCFPERSNGPELHARQAVHPLLPAQRAVANDIRLKPGQVTIITGSNMSGKTTYMRALGLNLKLAMAAGPVACAAMRLPPCELYTAISANDSLSQGQSYFMNEVVQLKEVLAGVEQCRQQPVYLLDELLKGTNERERNIAIIAVLKKLCAQQAMGMMTTHNIALATHPDLLPLCCSIYFEEDIDEQSPEKMRFSYRLKEGVSAQTNAIKLLRLLEIDINE
ncbi:hypothetical protein [Zobellella sp. DQSA1]|uniref:MutS-related protein n=1 Tax=Zobellella sp. DQSA1 TaxID=3342386 RepID=UPI0035BEDBCC